MRLLYFVTFVYFVAISLAEQDRCSYEGCLQELSGCQNFTSRKRCIDQGGIVLEYTKEAGQVIPDKKCCLWNPEGTDDIEDIEGFEENYLYCVKAISLPKKFCSTSGVHNYYRKAFSALVRSKKGCLYLVCRW